MVLGRITMINKEKLKFLPFNLILCLTDWILPFLILTQLTSLDIYLSILISTYIYLNNVVQTCNNDYLEARIKKLEDKNNSK
jgi:hypothetical protein